jgi:cytidylate kinase
MAASQRPFDPYQAGVKVYRVYRAGGRPAPQTTLVIRALNRNGHGNNGWWSIRESCGRRECGQHYIIDENNVRLYGIVIETKTKSPAHTKPHLVEYIAQQIEAMDDERLQNDLDAY